jgi:hypothetical protein
MTLLLNSATTLPLSMGTDVVVVGPYRDYGKGKGKGISGAPSAGAFDDELSRLNEGGNTTSVAGCAISGTDKSGFAKALAAAAVADVVVLALGA